MTATPELEARLVARVGPLRLDVDLGRGEGTLALVGPNGAGKSSVLAMLLGALPVESGRVSIGSAVLLDTSAGVGVPVEQRRLGYVPQDYALFPHLTARRNVEFALESAEPRLSRAARRRRAEELLADLGLGGCADERPSVLSGGEQQRVALARALAVTPRALLLDEPLGALDVHSRAEVRELLAARLERLSVPAVVVTHDAADARALGQRIAVLEQGTITQLGTWEELVAAPGSAFVQELVGSGCP